MKKILNWLVGSFFRTIGRFLAISGIGILFYLIASKSGLKLSDLLGISRVYADTGTYSSSAWSLRTINPNLSDCTYTTDNLLLCAYRGYETNKNLGDYYFDNTYNDLSVLVTDARLYAYASSTDKFLSSRFYTFNYTICQSNHISLSSLKAKTIVSQWGYNSSNAATGATMSNGSEVSLLISEVEGTTTINNTTSYCYNYQFSVTPKIDSRFIGFYIHYGTTKGELVVADTVNRAGTLYSVKSLDVTYSTGTGAVIQDSANQIINNNNQNTQDIINNQNNNTNTIINNQNQNTQDMIDSQKVCVLKLITRNDILYENKFLNANGSLISSSSDNGVTDYLEVGSHTIDVKVKSNRDTYNCFYDSDKTLISCVKNLDLSLGVYTLPTNTKYVRFTIKKYENQPQVEIELCKNGNQAVSDSINDLNDSINDSDVSQASSDASDLFNNFTTDSHGLTAVIQAPLNFIQSLSSKSCSVIHLPIPFLDNQYLDLPCLLSIYQEHFGTFLTLYQLIISGIIGYRIAVSIYFMVKDFKDPDSDKIEVLDL